MDHITLTPPEPAWFAGFRTNCNWELERNFPGQPLCPEWPLFWQHVMEVTGDDMYAYVSMAGKQGLL